MVYSGTIGQGERGSSGGRRSRLSSPSSGGDVDSAAIHSRERNLQRRLVLRKRYEEAKVRVEYLDSIGCHGWGPGITEDY